MRNILILAAILTGASFCNPVVGQSAKKRIQPGRMYNSQDTLFSPSYGFTSQVPVGWVGTLPRETEVFLLTTGNGGFGEIYVFGRAAVDLQQLS
jgi:hypothetical protein